MGGKKEIYQYIRFFYGALQLCPRFCNQWDWGHGCLVATNLAGGFMHSAMAIRWIEIHQVPRNDIVDHWLQWCHGIAQCYFIRFRYIMEHRIFVKMFLKFGYIKPVVIITKNYRKLTLIGFIRLDALASSVIATATWLAGWVAGCLSQPVLYQND